MANGYWFGIDAQERTDENVDLPLSVTIYSSFFPFQSVAALSRLSTR